MNFFTIWKTLWKQLLKHKLVLLFLIALCGFLYWISDPEHRSLPLALAFAAGIFRNWYHRTKCQTIPEALAEPCIGYAAHPVA